MRRRPGSGGSAGHAWLGGTDGGDPISKGRAVLSGYGIRVDVLKWTGADHEAPGPRQCPKLLVVKQRESFRDRLLSRIIHRVYAK